VYLAVQRSALECHWLRADEAFQHVHETDATSTRVKRAHKPSAGVIRHGRRVAAFGAPSQILVTQTVKDLVAGSRLSFTPVGERDLRGVSGARHLYAVSEDR
jgi:hypothetical protein